MKSKQKFHKKIYTSFSPTIPEENVDKKIVKSKFKLYIRNNNNQNNLLANEIQSNQDNGFIFTNENKNKKNQITQEDDYSPSVYNNKIFNKFNKKFYFTKTFSQKTKTKKKYNFSLNNINTNLNKTFDIFIPNFFIEGFDTNNSQEFLFKKLNYLFSKLNKKVSNNLLYNNTNKNLTENGIIEIPTSRFSRKNKTLQNNNNPRFTDQNKKKVKQNYVFYESIDTTNLHRHTKTLTDTNGLVFSDIENDTKSNNNKTIKSTLFSPRDIKIKNDKIITKNSIIKNSLVKRNIINDFNSESISTTSEKSKLNTTKNNKNGVKRIIKHLKNNSNNFTNNLISKNENPLKESIVKESHNHIEFNSINSSSNRKVINKSYNTSQEQPKFCFKKRILLEEEYIVNDRGEQKLICVKRLEPNNTNINNRNSNNNDELNNNIVYTTNEMQDNVTKQIYKKENNFIENSPNFYYRSKNNTQKNFYNNCPENSKSMFYDKINLKQNIINKNLNRVQSTSYYFSNRKNNNNIIVMSDDNINNNRINDQKFLSSAILCNKLSEKNKNNISLRKFTNLNQLLEINDEYSNSIQNNLINNYYNGYSQRKNHNFHEIKSISKDNRHRQFSNNNLLYKNKINYNSINSINCENNKNKKIVYVNRCNHKNNCESELKRNFTDKYYNSQLLYSQRGLSKKTTLSNDYNIPTTTSSTQYGLTFID